MRRRVVAALAACVMLWASGGSLVRADEIAEEEVSKEERERVILEFLNGSAEEKYIVWLEEVIAEFEEANPNIRVELQTISIDSYNQTVMTRFSSGDVPDLLYFSANDMTDMVPGGNILDLSGSESLEHYPEGMLDTFTADGKVYALPIANDFMCVNYNKAAFARAEIAETPGTWEEFLEVCRKLQKAGITPIAAGFAEQWVVNGTAQTVYCAEVLAGHGPSLAEMTDRSRRFSETEQWRGFCTKLQEIYPYMNEEPFGKDQNTCYSMFASGEVAMILNGTWTVTNATAMNPDAEFGIFPLPVSETAEENGMPMYPPESAVAVAAQSRHREEAVKFLEYMMSPESASLYAQMGAGIPIVKGADTSELNGAFRDAADLMNRGAVEVISSKSFPSAQEDAFIRRVSAFFLDGCRDIEGVLEALDADFDRLAGQSARG